MIVKQVFFEAFGFACACVHLFFVRRGAAEFANEQRFFRADSIPAERAANTPAGATLH